FGEDPLPMSSQVQQTQPRYNQMRPALQLLEHQIGLLEGCRLSEHRCVEINKRIRAQYKGVRELFRDGPGLAIGVDLRGFAGGKLVRMNLGRFARNHFELSAELTQKIAAPRRSGRKNKRGYIHRWAPSITARTKIHAGGRRVEGH